MLEYQKDNPVNQDLPADTEYIATYSKKLIIKKKAKW